MNTEKWFDRKFDLSFGTDKYASIYGRLQQAPGKLRNILSGIPEDKLVNKPEGKWSVKEHTGHLFLIESLWRTRFQDILDKKPVLTPADLDNRATSEAGFNGNAIAVLLEKFAGERKSTLLLLDSMNALDGSLTSLHPRMQQPMRIVDLAYFVAEHDDHHMACIREIIGQ